MPENKGRIIKVTEDQLTRVIQKLASGESEEDSTNDLILNEGKEYTLEAKTDEDEEDRGLIVKYREDGKYDVNYWIESPDNRVEQHVELDGKETPSVKDVVLGYHPES